MQTAKAGPVLEGRGWTVQRKVVRLEQQPYTYMHGWTANMSNNWESLGGLPPKVGVLGVRVEVGPKIPLPLPLGNLTSSAPVFLTMLDSWIGLHWDVQISFTGDDPQLYIPLNSTSNYKAGFQVSEFTGRQSTAQKATWPRSPSKSLGHKVILDMGTFVIEECCWFVAFLSRMGRELWVFVQMEGGTAENG
ncbi:hypothetical protein B0H19DRAFT_1071136 [Mycena capillaripes]|nr:hypothetical protein B0H19DRAFT_1071136 [Mycena capillaripes]